MDVLFRSSNGSSQGPVARSMVSVNHWLSRLSWYLTLVSANQASCNSAQINLPVGHQVRHLHVANKAFFGSFPNIFGRLMSLLLFFYSLVLVHLSYGFKITDIIIEDTTMNSNLFHNNSSLDESERNAWLLRSIYT